VLTSTNLCVGLITRPNECSVSECNSKASIMERPYVARMGEDRGVHRVLVGKPEGKRLLGRPRRGWGDNIKMDLQDAGGGREDWMELA